MKSFQSCCAGLLTLLLQHTHQEKRRQDKQEKKVFTQVAPGWLDGASLFTTASQEIGFSLSEMRPLKGPTLLPCPTKSKPSDQC